jgi:hypothetical protein
MRARVVFEALSVVALLVALITQGSASCLSPPASELDIAQFRSDPDALVRANSDARTVEATTRDLVGTDARLAPDFVRVAKSTTPRFRTAIAAGLALAAIACSTVDQKAALAIQQAVAAFEDLEFQASFAAVAGDLSTAATDAAAAYAAASVGSVIVVNPNVSPGSTLQPGGGGAAVAVQFSAPALSILTTTATTNDAATTAAEAVSATR